MKKKIKLGSCCLEIKNAFITFYDVYKDNTLELSNGFTFITHLIEGDHIFINNKTNIDEVKEKLLLYDKVYVSILFYNQLVYISKIIDDRWIAGGRFFSNVPRENWIKLIDSSIVYSSTFESYLNKPISSTFNSYWDEWIRDKNIPCLKYNAICTSDCYWRKCKFCKISYKQKNNDISRNIISVYNSLPQYNFVSVATLNSGALTPVVLKDLIREVQYNPKNKVLCRIWIRAEDNNFTTFDKASDLSGFVFNFGLESFSQKACDILQRGLKVRNILQLIKISIDKGAYVNITYMSKLPFIDEEIFNESMKNIEWLKENVKPESKIYFFDSCDIEWPSEDVAKEFGDYDIIESKEKSFSRHERKIISKISNEKNEMCSRIMKELCDYKIVTENISADRVRV